MMIPHRARSPILPPEIWHMIYCYLDIDDLVNLDSVNHPIRAEPESFWEALLKRFFIVSTVCRGTRDPRQVFLALADFRFSRLSCAPLVSSRTSSVFESQVDQVLVRSPFLVDSSHGHVAEVWDFAQMAKFRFDMDPKLAACIGVDGSGASLEKGQAGESVVMRYDYEGHVTHSFAIPFDSSECNIFCTNDTIDCTFLVQGLHKFYVNWAARELNDVGYISAAVNVANGQIFCLLGHSLAICDFAGNYTPLDVHFNPDLRSPRWVPGGGKRFLVISQSRGSTRLLYLVDAVNRTYVSWPVEGDKREPDEIQVFEDQVVMWYVDRERCLEEFLTPWQGE
ncbi:hypothetical protein B0I72DRAFT_36580 [Yarrowia lipolytica]|uniref:YALI0F04642p n=2 Tax=Yarrowia lipolytica TaxID=4952 RepID=Q6C2W2_YARLI|nr:YALI0F04642p [Yarrowia lipolytica CLIB122]AOW06664.1 hypothetical protein YALI1_F07135g [Yarrowia lipolytica]KAB8284775.1 hypothetical protein BKA91DRAFT_48258 [Yarrowia lipolytica]KAE8174807.1 hypothetical protein BKA90DRAFT_28271 [Yarrowia lipolytica]KAJ8056115.1 hypothetical protein LXG23DRAFT_48046 [Yarrowia lipolytica]RDW27302.1 hypothetical protein B0I71DRAFT_22880 [Yarrowia lipolytica]|eukprot:XP_505000.1 YALI0F04642p [Yarrowia lipolytica CLIB122]